MKCSFFILAAVFVFFVSCGGDNNYNDPASADSADKCRVEGKVVVWGVGEPAAVKIVLENVSNPDYSNVTYSNSAGIFVFENINPGFYHLYASKEGYELALDEEDDIIELVSGKTTSVSVIMVNYSDDDDGKDRKLQVLDLEGNPLNGYLEIQEGLERAGIQIYNGTGREISWRIQSYCLAASGYLNYVYCIESIDPAEGVLEQGTSVPIVLEINPFVYSYEIQGDAYLYITFYGWLDELYKLELRFRHKDSGI